MRHQGGRTDAARHRGDDPRATMVAGGAAEHLSTAASEMTKKNLSHNIKEMPRPHACTLEDRFFEVHEKIGCVHDEVWTLFEELLKLKRQVEGLKTASSKKRGGRGGRRSGAGRRR